MGWELVWFGPDDELAGTFLVSHRQLLQIRDLFDYGDDEWLTFEYPIRERHWPTLFRVLSCPPPVPGNAYFLHGYATPPSGP
ncbi:hypothetical protein [Actinomadura hibisca]|uniref:hypothetical protein n=1 Tax=Actinomadura hibisca TaxID=68565 RepID=UPI000834C040|nr:hypothetical protein [Actinomadura hibisca]